MDTTLESLSNIQPSFIFIMKQTCGLLRAQNCSFSIDHIPMRETTSKDLSLSILIRSTIYQIFVPTESGKPVCAFSYLISVSLLYDNNCTCLQYFDVYVYV